MGRVKIMKRSMSTKHINKNQTFYAGDFKYPIERTAGGTLYARLPTGQLVKLPDVADATK